MRTNSLTSGVLILALGCICGCSNDSPPAPSPAPPTPVPASVNPSAGYTVTVFAGASAAGTSVKPDSIITLGSNVFVGYGDAVNPDGTVPNSNPVVQGKTEMIEYDLKGNPVKTFSLPGHNDGLMAFDSKTIWAMSNEDANATLTVINITTGAQTQYTPTTPLTHGGGLDDMALINSVVYASASNPTVSAANIVAGGPAVISISLNANGTTFDWNPVIAGNAAATSMIDGSALTLNLSDPDSEAIDPSGNLVLDSQGDSELVFIGNPGATNQTAKVLPLTLYTNPWPVDDTRFVPTGNKPFLLFTDTSTNTIYRVDATFNAGDAFSAGQGTILKLNLTTGAFTPIIDGLGSPHGMVFLTQ